MSKVNVYVDKGNVITQVDYNSILVSWNGQVFCSAGGKQGTHKGLAKLEDGRYVLIHRIDATEWKSKKKYAEIISAHQAVSEIMKSCNDHFFLRTDFSDLNARHESLKVLQQTDNHQKKRNGVR